MNDVGNCCVYCGDWFECRDHPIPTSFMHQKRCYKPGETVKCCNSCNSLLGSKMFSSMEERSAFIFDRLTSKARRLLSLPIWELRELEELDFKLRTKVEADQHAKVVVKARLANLNLTASGETAIPIHIYSTHADVFREDSPVYGRMTLQSTETR